MPTLVVNGAQMQCSFGSAPATLVVTPEKRTSGVKVPAATIMDYVPMKKYPALRKLPDRLQPAGGRGHGRPAARRAQAATLHPDHPRAVGPWLPHRADWQGSRAEQHVQGDVRLWRRD